MLRRMAGDLLARERERAHRAVRRVALQVMLYLIAIVIVAIGVAFLIAALYLYLHGFLAAWQAGLATGGIAMVLALLLIAIASGLGGGRPRSRHRADSPRGSTQDEAAVQLGKVAEEMLSKANLRPADAAMIALVSGIALGFGAARRRRGPSGSDKQRN
ncbi:MAG: hypothetical protein WAL83_11095 [Arenicellales bacterium]